MLGTKIYKIKTREVVIEDGTKANDEYQYNHTQEFCDEYSQLAEWCNNNGCMIVDQGDYYEAVTSPAPAEPTVKEKLENELATLKAYLANTDYMAIKCGELGMSMASTYPNEYIERIKARARINEIETLLDSFGK